MRPECKKYLYDIQKACRLLLRARTGHGRLTFHLPDTWYACIMEAEQGVRGRLWGRYR